MRIKISELNNVIISLKTNQSQHEQEEVEANTLEIICSPTELGIIINEAIKTTLTYSMNKGFTEQVSKDKLKRLIDAHDVSPS